MKAHSNKKNSSPDQLFCILAPSPFTTALNLALPLLLMWKVELIVINQWEAGFLWAFRGVHLDFAKMANFIFFQGERKELEPHGDLTPSSQMLPTRKLTI